MMLGWGLTWGLPQPEDSPNLCFLRINHCSALVTTSTHLAPQYSWPQLRCWLCFISSPTFPGDMSAKLRYHSIWKST